MKKIFIFLILLIIFIVIYSSNNKSKPNFNLGLYNCKDCNVILITMTNLRFDHASFDGYERNTTPQLDKLAADSLVFSNAFSHDTWTLPESISIYTGLYPYSHGVMKRRDGSTLSKKTPTLMDYLNKEGYQTAAFTGGFDYNKEFGATGRFKTYKECAFNKDMSYPRQSGPRENKSGQELYGSLKCTVPLAVDWLKKNYRNKFFLHVQGFDAHCPFGGGKNNFYDPKYSGKTNFSNCLWNLDNSTPKTINGKKYYEVNSADEKILINDDDVKHMISLYDSSINLADSYIGQLLNEIKNLGLSEKTIIIFTSEHGDMLGKNGRFMRGGPMKGTFYDDVLHIPLIIKLPKITQKKITGLVAQIDLMPTILDLLNIDLVKKIDGKTFRQLIFNNQEVNDYIFSGAFFTLFAQNSDNYLYSKDSAVDVIRTLDWKLIRETEWEDTPSSPKKKITEELYNIKNDKEELKNVVSVNSEILKVLEKKLDDWSKKVKPKT